MAGKDSGDGGAVRRVEEALARQRTGRGRRGRRPDPDRIGRGTRERETWGRVGSGMGLGFDQGGRGGLVGRRGGPAWLGHGLVGPGAAGSFFLLFLFAFFLSFHNFLFCFF